MIHWPFQIFAERRSASRIAVLSIRLVYRLRFSKQSILQHPANLCRAREWSKQKNPDDQQLIVGNINRTMSARPGR